MLRRFRSTGFLIIVSTLLLIALIALVTFFAWSIINRTVQDQIQTAELQLVTSLSQQTQASLTNLEGDITSLAFQESIRATSPTFYEEALALIEEQAGDYPDGAIISATRFDFRGEPVYAWPTALNDEIRTLDGPDDYLYQVPEDLLELARPSSRVEGSDIPVELHRTAKRGQRAQTLLLIAPVEAVNLRTGFLVFEIDLSAYFADLYSFVNLGESGQLWVIDSRGIEQFEARPAPLFSSTYDSYTFPELLSRSRRASFIDAYQANDGPRQAAVASVSALNENFLIFISRLESEAQQGITENVVSIFGFAVAAVLVVVGLGSLVSRQIRQTNLARQEEEQRRETARLLLEISRALNSSLDLNTVLDRILAELGRLVPHDTASIMLLDEQELVVAANRGMDGLDVGNVLNLQQARAAREVIASGYPLVINDTMIDDRWTQSAEGSSIRSWMGLPLRVRDRFVGVLNINSYNISQFKGDDIELAAGFADQASVAIQNAQSYEIEVKQIEQELTIGRNIQTSLLPSAAPEIDNVEFAWHSMGASQVSGDYFQYLPMPDDKIGIAIGDVQGKGIPAALMMAVITTALRDEVIRHQRPEAILQSLNQRLIDRMKANHMNSALIIAVYDPIERQIEVANGGMVQPYLRAKGSDKFDFIQVGGYPLGMSESIRYSPKTIQFDEEAVLVMFSDGVVEAQSPTGEFFGFDRIESLLDSLPPTVSAQEVKERILSAVQSHLDTNQPQDDTTIIVMKGLPVAHPMTLLKRPAMPTVLGEPSISEADTVPMEITSPTPPVAHHLQLAVENKVVPVTVTADVNIPQCINVELYLPSKLGYEMVARGAVGALADELGYPEERIEDLKTAVAEACMNAIEHGNNQDLNQSIRILISIAPKWIEVRISDRGIKQMPTVLPAPGQGDMRGWGLFFIQHLTDIFEIHHLPDGGNEIRLVVYLNPSEGEMALHQANNLATLEASNTNGGHADSPSAFETNPSVDSRLTTSDTTT